MTCVFCSEPIAGPTELLAHRCRSKPSPAPAPRPVVVGHARQMANERQRRYRLRHPKGPDQRRRIDVGQVVAMRESGLLLREIAEATGFTTRTVMDALRRAAA